MLLVGLSSYRFKVFQRPNVPVDFFEFFSIEFAACLNHLAGPPAAERGPEASSNMTNFRSCEVQNELEKMPQFGPKYDVISKKKNKKRSSPKFEEFFRPKTSDLKKKTKKQVISKKKRSSSFTC